MALAAAAAVLWGSFTGCGNENSATTSDGKTRISIGNWPSKEGKDKENMEKKKERFEKENPEYEIIPDNWMFDLKSFYPKAAGGQLPTIYTTHFTEASQIIAAGYSADITDGLKKWGFMIKSTPM